MQPRLLELLKQDVYTDAPEYAERVKEIKDALATIAIADESLIEEARHLYQTDDIEIDDFGVETSRTDDATWVQAWVYVVDSDIGPDGKPRGECEEGVDHAETH
jgi:hypothetical protein